MTRLNFGIRTVAETLHRIVNDLTSATPPLELGGPPTIVALSTGAVTTALELAMAELAMARQHQVVVVF